MSSKVSRAWITVMEALNSRAAQRDEVGPSMFTDDVNAALDTVTSAFITLYTSASSNRERQINRVMSAHWVRANSNALVQFNISADAWAVEAVSKGDNTSKWTWPNFWKISNGTLTCLGFDLRCITKMEALNALFSVEPAEAKQLKSLFGNVYFGKLLNYTDGVVVYANSTLHMSLNELCKLLDAKAVYSADKDDWVKTYIKAYTDTLDRVRSQD